MTALPRLNRWRRAGGNSDCARTDGALQGAVRVRFGGGQICLGQILQSKETNFTLPRHRLGKFRQLRALHQGFQCDIHPRHRLGRGMNAAHNSTHLIGMMRP